MNQPTPDMPKGKGRRQLILLVTVFAAPIILAWIFYLNQSLLPQKTKNHGELITPARPLQDIKMSLYPAGDFELSQHRGSWVLLYIGDNHCAEDCAQALYNMRQSRLGQKGEHQRIKQVYVSSNGKPDQAMQKLLEEHPALQVLSAEQQLLDQFVATFDLQDGVDVKQAGRVYMIDPLGNVMVFYKKGFAAKGMAKDLEFLLKVSQVG